MMLRSLNKQEFYNACNKIIYSDRQRSGIGTYSEKTLHAVLKNYFEPDESNHEIRIGRFVADICRNDRIVEIQTRSFNSMRNKLGSFLKEREVTIVYPVAELKWISWIDEVTGEITKRRKSPKPGIPQSILPELYKIKQLLNEENLKICIVMLELEEYRSLNGWSKDKKKGSTRYDRIPVDILDEIYIDGARDYAALVPEELLSGFTSKDFSEYLRLSPGKSITALNVLTHVGAVRRIGKKGNAFLYEPIK
jgi:hypothetical protein